MKFISVKNLFILFLAILTLSIPSLIFVKLRPRPQKPFAKIPNVFSAQNAYQTVEYIEKRWRWVGNAGFNESIYYVEKILVEAGYKKEIKGETDGPLTYRIEKRKMKQQAWEPVSASLTLEGESKPVLQFSTNRNMLAINSGSTPEIGVTGLVVDVGKGTPKELSAKNIRGKIVFVHGSAYKLYNQVMQRGALGILAYNLPEVFQPTKHVNSIRFGSIPYHDPIKQKWAILLSYQAKLKIETELKKGPLQVTVQTKSKFYPSEELTLIANVRGKTLPDERFVFSAHLQEPGANDNATGVATLAEMARVTAIQIQNGSFSPDRTLSFIWGDEILSNERYIQENPQRAKGIKWAVSLDMTGENTAKTGGTFLIEKMPDPSALWTRGEDEHTVWWGDEVSKIKEQDLFPHYLHDYFLNRCHQEAKKNGWVVRSNPFEGGSDHTPYLDAKIPAILMWHSWDVFYHTDGDRLEMVSAEEMKNVGVCALTGAMILATANEEVTLKLIGEILRNALDRLKIEHELSAEEIRKGSKITKEKQIIEAWATWYTHALGKMIDINTQGLTEKIKTKILEAQNQVQKQEKIYLNLLQNKQ